MTAITTLLSPSRDGSAPLGAPAAVRPITPETDMDHHRKYELQKVRTSRGIGRAQVADQPDGAGCTEPENGRRRTLRTMMRTAAKVHLTAVFESIAMRAHEIGMSRPALTIRSMKRSWATHDSRDHSICLNIELAGQPKCCILRIVANELVELAEPQSELERAQLLRCLLERE